MNGDEAIQLGLKLIEDRYYKTIRRVNAKDPDRRIHARKRILAALWEKWREAMKEEEAKGTKPEPPKVPASGSSSSSFGGSKTTGKATRTTTTLTEAGRLAGAICTCRACRIKAAAATR